MSRQRMTRRSIGRVAASVVVMVSMFVLAACGAVIDTALTVKADGSGARTMVLTVPADDAAKISGGAAAIDASVRKRLPKPVEYSGATDTGGVITATFTIPFASDDAYRAAVQTVLAAGSQSGESVLEISDSRLKKGIAVDESFDSADLLEWAFDGLVDDGVVSSGDAGSMYEIGTTTLTYEGKTTTLSSGSISHEQMDDAGFTDVTMATTVTNIEATAFERTVTFTADAKAAKANKKTYEAFFADDLAGLDVKKSGEGTWTVTIAGDAAAIEKATSQAMQAESTRFAVERTSAKNDPITLLIDVDDHTSCANVCAAEVRSLVDAFSAPDGFDPRTAEIRTSADEPATFVYALPVREVSSKLDVGLFGALALTIDVAVDSDVVQLAPDGFTAVLDPGDHGALAEATADGVTTYTATITGDDAAELNANLTAWAPGAMLAVQDIPGNPFVDVQGYALAFSLDNLVPGHPVSSSTAAVTVPFGHSVGDGDGYQVESGIGGATVTSRPDSPSVSVAVSAPSLLSLIGGAVLLALIVGGVLALVLNRGRIAARFAEPDGIAPMPLNGDTAAGFAATSARPGVFSVPDDRKRRVPASASLLDGRPDVGGVGLARGSSIVEQPPEVRSARGSSVLDIPASATRPGGTSVLDMQAGHAPAATTSLIDHPPVDGASARAPHSSHSSSSSSSQK